MARDFQSEPGVGKQVGASQPAMIRTSRGKKRKRPPHEVPSSASVEVFSVTRAGKCDRVTKKRVVEGTKFELQGSPSTLLSTEAPHALPFSDVDYSQPLDEPGACEPLSLNTASRSASVSSLCCCHVTAR